MCLYVVIIIIISGNISGSISGSNNNNNNNTNTSSNNNITQILDVMQYTQKSRNNLNVDKKCKIQV